MKNDLKEIKGNTLIVVIFVTLILSMLVVTANMATVRLVEKSTDILEEKQDRKIIEELDMSNKIRDKENISNYGI